MIFELKPYKRIGSIFFGMTPSETESMLGRPDRVSKNRRSELEYHYRFATVRFSADEGKVVEVGFSRDSKVIVCGVQVFTDPSAFDVICEADGAPYEYMGFIVCLSLGVTLTGFHDNDESQKAITVFAQGRWDHLIPKMKRFEMGT